MAVVKLLSLASAKTDLFDKVKLYYSFVLRITLMNLFVESVGYRVAELR